MNIFTKYRVEIIAAVNLLVAQPALPAGLDLSLVAVDPPRDPSHGEKTIHLDTPHLVARAA